MNSLKNFKRKYKINLKHKILKRSIRSLIGNTIGATDGEIGKVKEYYFDDETWTIRYLVVETGNWLFSHKVLISTEVLGTKSICCKSY